MGNNLSVPLIFKYVFTYGSSVALPGIYLREIKLTSMFKKKTELIYADKIIPKLPVLFLWILESYGKVYAN